MTALQGKSAGSFAGADFRRSLEKSVLHIPLQEYSLTGEVRHPDR